MSNPSRPEYGTCPTCGMHTLPVQDLSPCGHDVEPVLAPLEAQGVVYSWTRSWSTPDDSRLIVMADFLDGALRVTGPLAGDGPVEIGDTVWAHVGTDSPYVLSQQS